jgi:hypothetical protein
MKKFLKGVVAFLTIVAVAEVMVFNVHFINKTLYPVPTTLTTIQKFKEVVGIKIEQPPEPTLLERVDSLMFKVGIFKEVPKAPEVSRSTKMWNSTKDFSKNTWNKTKEISSTSWDKTKSVTGNGWNATKDFSYNSYEKGKALLKSDK